MKNFALSALFLAFSISGFATDIETARQLIENGYYDDAKAILNLPKIKNSPEASLLSGRIAFLEYNFTDASRLYAAYRKARRNKGLSEEAELFEHQLSLAESFLDKVEDIAILDSITVDRKSFLSVYRLPLPAGQLLPPSALPFPEARQNADMVFANESEEFMMWSQPNSEGKTIIFETSRLNDGSWQKPEQLPEELADGGNACYPFMMPDGTTLYFASDGDDSMGGLDIFVASKDASTGEYLQPSNLGMPYNSPFNDYMLAIDELNGIGWWATDRNQIEGKTTVYVFVTNDLRKNIPADSDEAIQRAQLKNWRDSQNDPQKDYKALLAEIRNIKQPAPEKKAEFHLPVTSAKTYTLFSDFRSKEAAAKMKAYLSAKSELDIAENKLRDARKRFSTAPNAVLAEQIAATEKKIEIKRNETQMLLNDVYRLEKEKQ